MIQDELTKLADEADEDEEEGDAVTDEKQHSAPAVKAWSCRRKFHHEEWYIG